MLYTIDNITAAQTPHFEKPFSDIINDFDVIIEIGFLFGGLSVWLNRNRNPLSDLYCYDIDPRETGLITDDINWVIGDVFSQPMLDDIQKHIDKGRALILCDGGDKIREFNLFSRMIKPGDVIMAHDYAESDPEFHQIATRLDWDGGPEIYLADIQETITNQSLQPYEYEDFKNVFWGAFIKSK